MQSQRCSSDLCRITGRKEEERHFWMERSGKTTFGRGHLSPHEEIPDIFGRKIIFPATSTLVKLFYQRLGIHSYIPWTWPGLFRNPVQFAESINITWNTVLSSKGSLDLALSFEVFNLNVKCSVKLPSEITCPIFYVLFVPLVCQVGLFGFQRIGNGN